MVQILISITKALLHHQCNHKTRSEQLKNVERKKNYNISKMLLLIGINYTVVPLYMTTQINDHSF